MSNWPGTAGLPAVPSRAAWTRKSIQLPFALDNGETSAGTPEIVWGTGNPNGVVTSSPGDQFFAVDTGVTWTKLTGVGNTGWGFAGNTHDARAYGVKCDGVTDDTAAWLVAIAAVKALGSGTIIHPGGNSIVSRQSNAAAILLDGSNIAIQGRPGATITLTTTVTSAYAVYLGDITGTTQLTNVRIESVKIDCGSSTDTKGIRVGWTDHAVVKDCEVINIVGSSGAQGISVEGKDSSHLSTNALVEHNYVHNFTGSSLALDAILFAWTARCKIVHNDVHDTGRAIFLDGPNDHNVVAHNNIYNLTDNGIRVSALGGGLWSDNTGHVIAHNTIDTVAIDGIRCNGLGLVVEGNTVLNAANRGIKGDATQESTISNNVVRGCTLEGIMLARGPATEYNAPHRKNVISDNVITGCGGAGVRIQGGAFDGLQANIAFGNTVRGNYCYQNAIGGLEFEDNDDLLVDGNQLEENTTTGSASDKQGIYVDMLLALSSVHGIVIRGNRAWDLRSTGGGLSFRQIYGVRILCTNAGATLNGVSIEGNDCSYSVTNGIRVATADIAGTVGGVRIYRNLVTNTSNPIVCRSTDTGTGNIGLQGLKEVSGDRGDNDVTIVPMVAEPIQRFATVFTGNHTVTLNNASSTFGIPVGTAFRIVRTGLGSFTLTVQDSTPATIKVMPSATAAFVDAVWDGAAWRLAGYGTL